MVDVTYVEPYEPTDDEKDEVLSVLRDGPGVKPWTLKSRCDAGHDVLKWLLKDGQIRIDADGYLHPDERYARG